MQAMQSIRRRQAEGADCALCCVCGGVLVVVGDGVYTMKADAVQGHHNNGDRMERLRPDIRFMEGNPIHARVLQKREQE